MESASFQHRSGMVVRGIRTTKSSSTSNKIYKEICRQGGLFPELYCVPVQQCLCGVCHILPCDLCATFTAVAALSSTWTPLFRKDVIDAVLIGHAQSALRHLFTGQHSSYIFWNLAFRRARVLSPYSAGGTRVLKSRFTGRLAVNNPPIGFPPVFTSPRLRPSLSVQC